MHLKTVVKTKADTEDGAVEQVNGLLRSREMPSSGFDYFTPEETQIADDVEDEKDFNDLKAKERQQAQKSLGRAFLTDKSEAEGNEYGLKGIHLQKAGESLRNHFWSTERLAYDYTHDTDGENTYYVVTDRHY